MTDYPKMREATDKEHQLVVEISSAAATAMMAVIEALPEEDRARYGMAGPLLAGVVFNLGTLMASFTFADLETWVAFMHATLEGVERTARERKTAILTQSTDPTTAYVHPIPNRTM